MVRTVLVPYGYARTWQVRSLRQEEVRTVAKGDGVCMTNTDKCETDPPETHGVSPEHVDA